MHLLFHAAQLTAFLLSDARYGDAAHHGHHFGHIVLAHGGAVGLALFLPLLFRTVQLLQQLAFLVAQLRGLFIALAAHHLVLLLLHLFDLALHIQDGLGNHDVIDVYAAAGLVHGVDRLVR